MMAAQQFAMSRGSGPVGNPLILTQTDTGANDGAIVACSGATLASGTSAKQATKDASAGSTPVSLTIDAAATKAALMFQSAAGEPNAITWAAGTWVVRVNVTTGASLATVTIEEVHVCRVNSSGVSQGTVGSLTAQAVNVDSGSEGVKTFNVPGVESTGDRTDEIYIVVVFKNTNGLNSDPTITPDQNINTPVLV